VAWIITNPPQSLRLLSRSGMWINVECGKCRRVRSLRPFEIDKILAGSAEELTLDDLRRKGKCEKPGCDGRVKEIEVSDPSGDPMPKRITWDELRLLKAMRS